MKKTRTRKVMLYTIAIVAVLWVVSLLSPELTIRRYMLTRLQPISAVTSHISNMERYDKQYGHLYNATQYKDWATGERLEMFYLKKFGLIWLVARIGSAP